MILEANLGEPHFVLLQNGIVVKTVKCLAEDLIHSRHSKYTSCYLSALTNVISSSLLEMDRDMLSPHISGDTWHGAHLKDSPVLGEPLGSLKLVTGNITRIPYSLKQCLTDELDAV